MSTPINVGRKKIREKINLPYFLKLPHEKFYPKKKKCKFEFEFLRKLLLVLIKSCFGLKCSYVSASRPIHCRNRSVLLVSKRAKRCYSMIRAWAIDLFSDTRRCYISPLMMVTTSFSLVKYFRAKIVRALWRRDFHTLVKVRSMVWL